MTARQVALTRRSARSRAALRGRAQRTLCPGCVPEAVQLRPDCLTSPTGSGNLAGSAALTLIGPQGSVILKEGAIIQMRHIHFHPDEAREFGVKDRDILKISVGNPPRDGVVSVLARVRADMKLECHLDTDEGNSFNVKNGDRVKVVS